MLVPYSSQIGYSSIIDLKHTSRPYIGNKVMIEAHVLACLHSLGFCSCMGFFNTFPKAAFLHPHFGPHFGWEGGVDGGGVLGKCCLLS